MDLDITEHQKTLLVYDKMLKGILLSNSDEHFRAYLILVLNEISSDTVMAEFTTLLSSKTSPDLYNKLAEVLEDTTILENLYQYKINFVTIDAVKLSDPQELKMRPMGLGLEIRTRTEFHPSIISVGSLHLESNYINTDERSIGMPQNSGQDKFSKLLSRGQIQISSTSANDDITGTKCRKVQISGLCLNDDLDWLPCSETIEMDGQTASVSVGTTWWRVNNLFMTECGISGAGASNEGDIYISPEGTSLTLGVPDSDIIAAMLPGFGASTMGDFSVGTNQVFVYTKGNFWTSESKAMVIREQYRQGGGSGDGISDLVEYQVGYYPSVTTSFDYTGAGNYTPKSDILMSCFTTTGSTDRITYYVEFCLANADKMHSSPTTFTVPF